MFYGLSWCSNSKESACNVGDQSSTPGLRRSPGEGRTSSSGDSISSNRDCFVDHNCPSVTYTAILTLAEGSMIWMWHGLFKPFALKGSVLLGFSYKVLVLPRIPLQLCLLVL